MSYAAKLCHIAVLCTHSYIRTKYIPRHTCTGKAFSCYPALSRSSIRFAKTDRKPFKEQSPFSISSSYSATAVATSSHSGLCEANEILYIEWLVLKVIQYGKEEYESLMPGTVQLCTTEGSNDTCVHRSNGS